MLKRLLAILLVVAGIVSWAASAAADEPDADQAPLGPTQVRYLTERPEEFDAVFPIDWGGGSLLQLKSRLQTLDCLVDTVWVFDEAAVQWHAYSQYRVLPDLTSQLDFLARFDAHIPQGRLWVSCFDFCQMTYIRANGEPVDARYSVCEDGSSWDGYGYYDPPFVVLEEGKSWLLPERVEEGGDVEWLTCDQGWNQDIQNYLLPNLPVMRPVCGIHTIDPGTRVPGKAAGGSHEPRTNLALAYGWLGDLDPFRVVFRMGSAIVRIGGLAAKSIEVESHELCHSHQEWQVLQEITVRSLYGDDLPESVDVRDAYFAWFAYAWTLTRQGSEFIDAVGFERGSDGRWYLPASSQFLNWYGGIMWFNVRPPDDIRTRPGLPVELAAELCSQYLLAKLDPGHVTLNLWGKPAEPVPDEIIDWLERYVWVLPFEVER